MHADLLLNGPLARTLYRGAADLPIVDYHSHLPASRLASNEPFANLTSIWITGDHYKYRAMRLNGIAERFCTGDASDEEKFTAWASTVPFTVRNPLYHWSSLELQGYFDIEEPLTPESAPRIWKAANEKLRQPELRPIDILERRKVRVLCTTDDPADDLIHHETLRADRSRALRVYPTYRPDAVLALAGPRGFADWVRRLAVASEMKITSVESLLSALQKRHDDFQRLGCCSSDHGLEHCYPEPCDAAAAQRVFLSLLAGEAVTADQLEGWRAFIMRSVAEWNHEKGWVMMLHLGAIRNNNTRMHRAVGLDSGCDSIGDFPQARRLNAFLDSLDAAGKLPKTILFNSNPNDNLLFATVTGNFFEDGVAGKVQHGPAWWFLDQADGIRQQFDALSQVGLAHRFVGMVTDSRSFMSFSRHDYYRRVMASTLAADVAARSLAEDAARGVMDAVCFTNARDYFAWQEKPC
jgi:glucuronate isomerase